MVVTFLKKLRFQKMRVKSIMISLIILKNNKNNNYFNYYLFSSIALNNRTDRII